MMRRGICTLFLILAAGLDSNTAIADVSSVAGNPQLKALFHPRDGSGPQQKALKISRLDLEVDISGGTAQTRATVQFENPETVAIEGEFELALPAGSVVNGYALDIGDRMVDGVLVGRRKATLAYEARVRQGVDPGLAEVTQTNAFRTKVFPIFPRRGRTIRLSFVTPLVPDQDFILPLRTSAPIGALSILVKTSGRQTPPRLTAPLDAELKWVPTAAGFEARAQASNVLPSGTIEVGPPEAPQTVSLSRHRNGEVFFEINDSAPAPNDRAMKPQRVRVYWDHSLSRRDDDLVRERKLLQRYLDEVAPGIVDLVLFDDRGPELQTFESPNVGERLDQVLSKIDYRGATSLEDVLDAPMPMAEACLFFSDGTVSIDSYAIERVRCPLFTISSASDAERGVLSLLARRAAATYFDLTAIGSDDDVIARLTGTSPRIVSVTAPDGRAIDYAVLPSEPERFRIVGPAPASGEVIVTLASGAKRLRTYQTVRAQVPEHDAMGAFWAIARVAELNTVDGANTDRVVALSRRYSIATFATVFLVLETPFDYANAGIEPPPSFGKPALMQYRELRAQAERVKADAQAERLETVVAKWAELKTWWQTDYPNAPRPAPVRRSTLPPVDPLRAVPSLPPPPPPPPAPPPSGKASDELPDTVLITGSLIRGTAAVGVPVSNLSPQDFAQMGGAADLFRNYSAAGATPGAQERGSEITVALEPWNPDRPYLAKLVAAAPDKFWTVYQEQEREYGTLPAFYLDVGELLFRQGKARDAIHVALSALEFPTRDASTASILADRLLRYGDEKRAFWLYERIALLDPDRPQPKRNLALALIARADRVGSSPYSAEARRKDYSRALELLNEIVTTAWDSSYNGIELIALMEANRVIPRLKRLDVSDVPLDPRLVTALDVDLRVVLEWDTGFTDVDLWVEEPSNERAYFSHPRTSIGGRVSDDMTLGYGPEEYLLKRAASGTYAVRVNVYATDRLNPNGATNVRVHLYRDYNRSSEAVQTFELELKREPGQVGQERDYFVGTFTVNTGMHMAQQ